VSATPREYSDIRELRDSVLLAIAALALLLCMSCAGESKSDSDAVSLQPAAGEQAEVESGKFVFSAYDIDGTLRSTDEWVGKQPVVLNFWGTWCPPCRKEIPDLIKAYNEFHPKGVEIIGLAVKDTPDKVVSYTKKNGMEWVMLMAGNDLVAKYRITGVPTTIFIDKNGTEIGRFVGPRDLETFRMAFEATMGG